MVSFTTITGASLVVFSAIQPIVGVAMGAKLAASAIGGMVGSHNQKRTVDQGIEAFLADCFKALKDSNFDLTYKEAEKTAVLTQLPKICIEKTERWNKQSNIKKLEKVYGKVEIKADKSVHLVGIPEHLHTMLQGIEDSKDKAAKGAAPKKDAHAPKQDAPKPAAGH